MGSTQCHLDSPYPKSSCNISCKCFANDKNIKNIDVIRTSSLKWTWSSNHDQILKQSLVHYQVPIEIMNVLKVHVFCDNEEYHIFKQSICREQYYDKIKCLLSKNLCSQWYLSRYPIFQSFPIALIGKGQNNRAKIFSSFADNSLPALQQFSYSQPPTSVRRTIFVDQCQVAVDLTNLNIDIENEGDVMDIHNHEIFFIVLDKYGDIKEADDILQTMMEFDAYQKKTFIVVKPKESFRQKHDTYNNNNSDTYNNKKKSVSRIKSEQSQLFRNYNISFIETSLNSEKSIQDLFTFAIKLYWFQKVK